MQDYVYVLMESELHEGTYLRGIFTSRYDAEVAMKELQDERDANSRNPDVYSFWVETQYLNQIIRGSNMEPVEMYRVIATNPQGRVCKRWQYNSKKTFEAQKKRRKYYSHMWTIVCEKLDYNTGTWVPFVES